ncbi:hypothetical protein [Microbulbifer rhizosphaerae]|uniref:DUF2845 domain-containing protein n=1 Tax=Microbulbifer rhizosphaerae TaxID=1562603 RepID=A0A7W4WET1_9GAMM|nr:hypothetical protein [Microbulbifer rhizosphaerae]MBB3062333.1 hypothetical protein [Microbulbifer rhizosphaerae]
MKKLKIALFGVIVAIAFSAHAKGSFRLPNGKLILEGKSKQEIIYIAGAPMYQEVETIAVDEGTGGTPIKREILTYRLPGSLGGMSLVVVTIENNKVVSVESKQESRI